MLLGSPGDRRQGGADGRARSIATAGDTERSAACAPWHPPADEVDRDGAIPSGPAHCGLLTDIGWTGVGGHEILHVYGHEAARWRSRDRAVVATRVHFGAHGVSAVVLVLATRAALAIRAAHAALAVVVNG